MSAIAMLIAMALDLLLGWPDRLYRMIGHPVGWVGRLIVALDHTLNRPDSGRRNRIAGVLALVICLLVATLPFILLHWLSPSGLTTLVLTAMLAYPLIAARSLAAHVADVDTALQQDIAAGRQAVARIVGRQTAQLDAPAIRRATLESLAENASDGVIAPLFWGMALGLPGIVAYKVINTADSMIGHRSPRYRSFGWAAARLDDAINWIPARLTGLLLCLVPGGNAPGPALRLMWAEARQHRSPNAGWPEAAMAARLNLRLSGPRSYGNTTDEEPWLNSQGDEAGPDAIAQGLRLYRHLLLATAVLLAILALTGRGLG